MLLSSIGLILVRLLSGLVCLQAVGVKKAIKRDKRNMNLVAGLMGVYDVFDRWDMFVLFLLSVV